MSVITIISTSDIALCLKGFLVISIWYDLEKVVRMELIILEA